MRIGSATSAGLKGFSSDSPKNSADRNTKVAARGTHVGIAGGSVRLPPQLDTSLNPRPLRIIGTHFSARAALVFACFADETWKMYDFLRPGVSVANADLRTALSSSLLCNSSGIGYSEGFFRSIFVPDSSNS